MSVLKMRRRLFQCVNEFENRLLVVQGSQHLIGDGVPTKCLFKQGQPSLADGEPFPFI